MSERRVLARSQQRRPLFPGTPPPRFVPEPIALPENAAPAVAPTDYIGMDVAKLRSMKKLMGFLSLAALLSLPVPAQEHGGARGGGAVRGVGGGHIPAHGPAPARPQERSAS